MFHHPATGKQSSVVKISFALIGCSLSEGISNTALEISSGSIAFTPATFIYTSEEFRLRPPKRARYPAFFENMGFFSQMLFRAFVIA